MNVERNAGLVSPALQAKLANTTVAIAGVGGDGGLIAELMVRLGIGSGPLGGIRLADPDTFGAENLNRQAFCSVKTLGRNKAEVLAEELAFISPDAVKDRPLTEGVSVTNVERFLAGADVVVDETDYEKHWVGIALARQARALRLPVFTGLNVGWGCEYTSFAPGGYTMERFLGLRSDASLTDIQAAKVDLSRWVVHLPPYAQYSVFRDIQKNGRTVPSVSPGVAMAAAHVVTQVVRYLSGKRVVTAPRVGWDDPMQGRRGVVRSPSMSFFYTLAMMVVRSELGTHERLQGGSKN